MRRTSRITLRGAPEAWFTWLALLVPLKMVSHVGVLFCLLSLQTQLSPALLWAISQKNAHGRVFNWDASADADTRCRRPKRARVWFHYMLQFFFFFDALPGGQGWWWVYVCWGTVGVQLLSPSLCDVIPLDLRRPAAERQRFSGRLSWMLKLPGVELYRRAFTRMICMQQEHAQMKCLLVVFCIHLESSRQPRHFKLPA